MYSVTMQNEGFVALLWQQATVSLCGQCLPVGLGEPLVGSRGAVMLLKLVRESYCVLCNVNRGPR